MRPLAEIRLLLFNVLVGILATTIFLVAVAVGSAEAIRVIGYVVGGGALVDLTLTLAARAFPKRP